MGNFRVLQLISSGGFYGAENMVIQLCFALDSLNCEVTLGAFQNSHQPNTELVRAAQSRRLDVELIGCRGRIDLQTVAAIRKCIVDRQIDVVHSHGYKANIYGYLAVRGTDTKIVATCHNWPGKSIALRSYAALDRFFLRRFSGVGAVSSAVQATLIRSSVPKARVSLIENGVNTDTFSCGTPVLKQIPSLQDKKIVGFVGRLVKEKGLGYLMNTAACIVRDDPNVSFVIAGDGPFRTELSEIIKKLGIENDVVVLGSRADLADVYASMDIFVLPSLTEGMPMAVLEAMAAGKPVLATNVGAVPQLVQNGQTGFLVDAADGPQLTIALKRLLAAPELCKELGQRGRERVVSRFSSRAMAESYLKMYREAITQAEHLLPNASSTPMQTAHLGAKHAEPEISVVVPAMNEEAVIGRCLRSLCESDCPKSAFEVIVVDNGSTDRTLEIVKSFAHILTLRVLKVENVHISALRNRGAADARGKFLAFLDSDCLAPSSWLPSALRLLENAPFAVVGAHYGIPDDATWVGRIWTQDRFGEKIGDVPYVPAGDLLISRENFHDIGGFDESIQTNEDIELCARARGAGLGVRAYPELRVTHLGTPRTLLAFYRKQRWHGTHVFKVFLKDPNKRRNRRPVFLALYTLACIAGMLIGAIFGAVGASWAISAAFVVLLVLPLTLLAAANSVRRRKWREAIPLTLIYLSFAIARARAVVNYGAWKSDLNAKALPAQPSCKASSS